jgi:hypothetical protein
VIKNLVHKFYREQFYCNKKQTVNDFLIIFFCTFSLIIENNAGDFKFKKIEYKYDKKWFKT